MTHLIRNATAELFGTSSDNIRLYLKNIFSEGELVEQATTEDFSVVRQEGEHSVRRSIKHYNLDAIISVGYRVNSLRATQVLKTFAVQGYVIDRERMENGSFLSVDYFEKLLSEIREIHLNERLFYQKITDIYATSVDYNKDAAATKAFFAKVQNKLHYAIHGHQKMNWMPWTVL